MTDFMGDDIYKGMFGSLNATYLAVNGFREYYADILSARLTGVEEKPTQKFTFLSGHDTTVALYLRYF
jgi:hypothetical protein